MASRYPEHDIFPKEGIDLRDPSGTEWLANVWRPDRAHRIAVRPGFGQLTQQDCTAEKANVGGALPTPATGGYQRHLGSFLYNTNFGHRQIISVFESVVEYSSADAPLPLPSTDSVFRTVHGAEKTAVVSIYDLTTGAQWEEVLVMHTSENCDNNGIPDAHGHFETSANVNRAIAEDFIKFRYHRGTDQAAFAQMGDSVVLMLGNYGVWIYHGIDVAKTKQRLLDATDIAPTYFIGSSFTVGTNYPTGDCEGSVLQPVSGVRGLNGEQFTYFTKSEFPKAHAATISKGRMVYALRGVLYFSDVGQPGAIMADNFAEIQTEGNITAIGEHNGQIYALTETETHLLQVHQNTRAGAAFANVVSVNHVRISKRTGCVGPRALVETPFGVCWVSSKGCHLAGGEQSVQDLSDPIQDYWDAGIVNPASHFFEALGAGGTTTQPDVIYKHVGIPTLGYEPETESLLVAYDDHLLVYQFRHQSWTIWPLASTSDGAPITPGGGAHPVTPVVSRRTINCLQVLSDSQGTYLVGGLFDSDEGGLTPSAQSSSYYVTELGLGGALDRSCKDEDHRRYGWGRYEFSVNPTASVLASRSCFFIEKPQRIFTSDDGARIIYEFPVYFEVFRPNAWPPNLLVSTVAFRFNITWNAAFTFEGAGVFNESSPRSHWTFTSTPTSLNSARDFAGLTNLPVYRMPLYVLRLSAPIGSTGVDARTGFTVVNAEATDPTGTFFEGVRVMMWQQQHLYAPATTTANNRLVNQVEWGYKTGQVGLNEGKELRVRGINTVMESSTSQSSRLYNSYTVSDYKRLSGQLPDYVNLTPGNRKQIRNDLLRERMIGGRRVFNSIARWAPVAPANYPGTYLIDSPELNSVVTSVSARGEHVSVGLYGFSDDKADELSMHRMSIAVLDTGNRRRKGR